MIVPRQYFTVATDYPKDMVYVIGGYNSSQGVLNTFETFSIRSRKWQLCEDSQVINVPRIVSHRDRGRAAQLMRVPKRFRCWV